MSHYTEEEQIALIKEWWKRNGKPLVIGAIAAIAIIFSWQAWQTRKAEHAQRLSTLYQQLLETAASTDNTQSDEIIPLFKSLQELAPRHTYTQYAQLLLARIAVEQERLDDAVVQLQAVLESPANPILEELAKQRLARVLAIQDKAEEALKLLEGQAVSAYQSMRDELRGDILLQLGREKEARAAYQQAQKNLPDTAAAGILLMKLDDLAQKDA